MAFDVDQGAVLLAPYNMTDAATSEARRNPALLKRGFDIVFSAAALIALAPVMLIVAIALRLREPGPVFFAHNRTGINGRQFKCLKFRTMHTDGDERLARVFDIDPVARKEWQEDQKLENDPRVHSLGDFLRKSSLDELPQFWNVLRGDMSIVGPRPITSKESVRYGRHFSDYCSVKPGITGAWQVGGRSETTYEYRVGLDVDYIRNASFLDDIRIVIKTVGVVLARKGAH